MSLKSLGTCIDTSVFRTMEIKVLMLKEIAEISRNVRLLVYNILYKI